MWSRKWSIANKKVLTLLKKYGLIYAVDMRDTDKYSYFLNVTFKLKRNPNYKGGHYLARTNSSLGNTYTLGTSKEEMIKQFLDSDVNNNEKTRDMVEVVEITKCFEDRTPKGRFHKDNY